MDRDGVIRKIVAASPRLNEYMLRSTMDLALEIARDVREGRRVGTLFTVGHAEEVLAQSRPLILDPLAAHPPETRKIDRPDLRGTVKELAQLDGAFVLTEEGRVESACRYLDLPTHDVELSLGLGSRHLAGAAASRCLGTVAIVVSESGVVRIFVGGELVAELNPLTEGSPVE